MPLSLAMKRAPGQVCSRGSRNRNDKTASVFILAKQHVAIFNMQEHSAVRQSVTPNPPCTHIPCPHTHELRLCVYCMNLFGVSKVEVKDNTNSSNSNNKKDEDNNDYDDDGDEDTNDAENDDDNYD